MHRYVKLIRPFTNMHWVPCVSRSALHSEIFHWKELKSGGFFLGLTLYHN